MVHKTTRIDQPESSISPSLKRTPGLELFPEIEPYSSGFLEVDDDHSLYWEQSGNPDGIPIVLLHGGPGAGATPAHRRFFNPSHYRIIIFDQRGAGRSQPLGCLKNNTPEHLVEDLEKIRNHLKVEKWHIFGGSWGSTLGILYAEKHPKRCISLILRGIFLLEQSEVDWFINDMKMIFPEAWEQFAAIATDAGERENLLDAYIDHLNSDDEAVRMEAAIAWSLYEGACSSLMPNYETITTDEQKDHALALALIESHYFKHNLFDKANSLLNNIDMIREIPTTIIHGRYDIICPIITAQKVHEIWPEADYIVVPDGGHSALDPSIRSRLIEATENAKNIR